MLEGILAGILLLGAVIVCVPILIASMVVAFLVTVPLQAIGVPDVVLGGLILFGGFGGGLVLCFLAMAFVFRHLPAPVRTFLFSPGSADADDDGPAPVLGHDPHTDPATIDARVRAADDALDRTREKPKSGA